MFWPQRRSSSRESARAVGLCVSTDHAVQPATDSFVRLNPPRKGAFLKTRAGMRSIGHASLTLTSARCILSGEACLRMVARQTPESLSPENAATTRRRLPGNSLATFTKTNIDKQRQGLPDQIWGKRSTPKQTFPKRPKFCWGGRAAQLHRPASEGEGSPRRTDPPSPTTRTPTFSKNLAIAGGLCATSSTAVTGAAPLPPAPPPLLPPPDEAAPPPWCSRGGAAAAFALISITSKRHGGRCDTPRRKASCVGGCVYVGNECSRVVESGGG